MNVFMDKLSLNMIIYDRVLGLITSQSRCRREHPFVSLPYKRG